MEIKFMITSNQDVEKLGEIVEKLKSINFDSTEVKSEDLEKPKASKKETDVVKKQTKKQAKVVEKHTEEKKEEIAAENVETSEYEITDVRAKLAEKVKDHRDAIKSKLNDLGAANVTNLKPENYSEFMDFLNSL